MCKKIKYGCFFEKKFVELFWKSFSGRKSSLEPSFFEFLTGFHMVWKNQESWEIWWNAFWGNRYSIWCGMTQKWKTNCWRYHHFTHVYQKPQSYEVRFLWYGVRQTEFFVILVHFLPFHPITTHKIKILKKWKKKNCICLHFTRVSKIMIIYASWDMECNRNNFLSFWAMFWPFTPLLTPKTTIWKKCKKSLEILSFYMCV